MKKLLFIVLVLSVFSLSGCQPNTKIKTVELSNGLVVEVHDKKGTIDSCWEIELDRDTHIFTVTCNPSYFYRLEGQEYTHLEIAKFFNYDTDILDELEVSYKLTPKEVIVKGGPDYEYEIQKTVTLYGVTYSYATLKPAFNQYVEPSTYSHSTMVQYLIPPTASTQGDVVSEVPIGVETVEEILTIKNLESIRLTIGKKSYYGEDIFDKTFDDKTVFAELGILENYEVNIIKNYYTEILNVRPVVVFRDDYFEYKLYSKKNHYAEDEEVEIYTTIEYIGPNDSITIYSGKPYLSYWVKGEMEKPFIEDLVLEVLVSTVLEKNTIYTHSLEKVGGFSNDDKDANFWREFYTDPLMIFPTGEYDLKMLTGFYFDEDEDYFVVLEYWFTVED